MRTHHAAGLVVMAAGLVRPESVASQARYGAGPSVSTAIDSALGLVRGWSGLVRSGGAGPAWTAASTRFQYRISATRWDEWVRRQARGWEGVAAPDVIGLELTSDRPPLPPAEWLLVRQTSARARGGEVIEVIWAVREGAKPWQVVDYAVWPDPRAVVTNAVFLPVPYEISAFAPYPHHRFGHGTKQPPPAARPAGPEPSRSVANPATFPRRPPG